jgi:ADP-ribose pyrophosphatase YjhB (NUDIX family)
MDGRETRVLLGFRKIYPYDGRWALPGGRIIKGNHGAPQPIVS